MKKTSIGMTVLGLAAIGLSTSCDKDAVGSRSEQGAPARDTVDGVEIVTTRRHIDSLPMWRLEDTPAVSIDGSDTGAQFYFVTAARRLRDGTFLLLDQRLGTISRFSDKGRYIGNVLSRGGGPADVQVPHDINLIPGDSIAVLDGGMFSILLGPGLEPIDKVTYSSVGLAFGSMVVGYVSSDALVALSSTDATPKEVGARFPGATLTLVKVSRTSRQVDTLGTIGERDMFTLETTIPDGKNTKVIGVHMVAFGSRAVYTVGAGRIYLARTDTAAIRVYSPAGKLNRIIRWSTAPDTITDADRHQSFIAESTSIAEGRDPAFVASMLNTVKNQVYATLAPYFDGFIAGNDGALWVEKWARGSDSGKTYIIVDSTGVATALLRLPPRTRIHQVSGDIVLVGWRNDDDVDYVRLHRIIRP